MATTEHNARESIENQLQRLVETMRDDLDRIELLTGAMNAFSKPVPEYEPHLHHLHPALGSVGLQRKNSGSR